MVVAVGVTVIDEPVPTNVPPQLPVYHFQAAPLPKLPPATVKVTAVGPHTVVADAVAPVGAVDNELMVMVAVAVTAPRPPAAAMV